ncbi:MAG: MBL fold metallo-hydrolase [Candidatus Saganbacteria bacterium]|nr:MBL fold metallo-hydrolase [Candidatus Saganbacteria bacterium]
MIIKSIKVGSLQTNCYVVVDGKTNQAMVIDPGDEAVRIVPLIRDLEVRYIVVTHGHPDHFGALEEIKRLTGAPLLASPWDSWFYQADRPINDGEKIELGSLTFTVLVTAGHSKGCICLYSPGHLFSGDTLFAGTCGRMDLPGGSEDDMRASLRRLSQLPPETKVYPGHGEFTTIGREKELGTLG